MILRMVRVARLELEKADYIGKNDVQSCYVLSE